MRTIEDYAAFYRTDKRHCDHNFTEFYEDLLGHLRDKPIKILEFGVKFGSSICMWEGAFPKSDVYCVDNAPRWRMKPVRAKFEQLDLTDREALSAYCHANGPWDVVVDDSAHTSTVTRNIIETLWPDYIRKGGYLIIEDTNSGYKNTAKPGTSQEVHDQIDYCMSLVKNVNHSGMLTRCGPRFWGESSEFDKAIKQIIYRPGVMAIQRR